MTGENPHLGLPSDPRLIASPAGRPQLSQCVFAGSVLVTFLAGPGCVDPMPSPTARKSPDAAMSRQASNLHQRGTGLYRMRGFNSRSPEKLRVSQIVPETPLCMEKHKAHSRPQNSGNSGQPREKRFKSAIAETPVIHSPQPELRGFSCIGVEWGHEKPKKRGGDRIWDT
jgi:hypothetical protein